MIHGPCGSRQKKLSELLTPHHVTGRAALEACSKAEAEASGLPFADLICLEKLKTGPQGRGEMSTRIVVDGSGLERTEGTPAFTSAQPSIPQVKIFLCLVGEEDMMVQIDYRAAYLASDTPPGKGGFVARSCYVSPGTGEKMHCRVAANLDGGPIAAGLLSASHEHAITEPPYDLGGGCEFVMKRNAAVPSCFAAEGGGVNLRIITFGDDSLLSGSARAVALLVKRMEDRFSLQAHQVLTGVRRIYCGLGFTRRGKEEGGGIAIDVEDAQAGLRDYLEHEHSCPEIRRTYHVPISQSAKFDDLGIGKGELINDRGYFKLVGKCLYLTQLAIIPAVFPLKLLARRVRLRGLAEEKALLALATYLANCHFGLVLPPFVSIASGAKPAGIRVSVEFDATPGSAESKGTTAAVVLIGGVPIDFVAVELVVRQASRATKAVEYLSAARGVIRSLNTVRMIVEMPGVGGELLLPILATGDCTSANREAHQQGWGVGMTAFDASAVFLKDLVQVGVVRVDWVSGRENIADGLTKIVVKGVYEARAPAFGLC